MSRRIAVLAAGGTGGHMFPAEALARELGQRGWRVVLATDARGDQYAHAFPAGKRIALNAATAKAGDPVGMARAAFAIAAGVSQARTAFHRLDPSVVVGFGGYPSVPALLAALSQKRPTVIHEQNAVLGRSNRLLGRYVDAVACAFPTLEKATLKVHGRAEVVGNPVRPEIGALYGRPFVPPGDEIRVLVTGGSQGARVLSETAPLALAALPEALRARLRVQQQARAENLPGALKIYNDALIQAEVAPFFRDMAERLGQAHLVIGRAGASTCSELAVAGRPSILVPLKIAADDHQRLNARQLVEAGAATVILEDDLSVERLMATVAEMLADPDALSARAAAATSVATPDAARRLADLVERTAG